MIKTLCDSCGEEMYLCDNPAIFTIKTQNGLEIYEICSRCYDKFINNLKFNERIKSLKQSALTKIEKHMQI